MAAHESQVPRNQEAGRAGELAKDRFLGRWDLTRWRAPLGSWLVGAMRWLSARLGPHAALILALIVGAGIAALLTYASAEVYDAVTEADGVAGLDHPILDAAISVRSPWLDAAMTGYTDIAGTIGMPLMAVTIMAVLAFKRRSWTPVILIATAGAGSLLMTIAGKQLIGRARPPLMDAVPPFEYSPSFPSGHTLNALVIAGVVAYLLILRQRTPPGPGPHHFHGWPLCVHHRTEPHLPRPPLVHRRASSLDSRSRMAGPRDHSPPNVSHG